MQIISTPRLFAVSIAGWILLSLPPSALAALSDPQSRLETRVESSEIAQRTDFDRHFQELGVQGSILIYDLNAEQFYAHNPDRNATAFHPASTFKILNSLIALETGVIDNEVAVLTWDGIDREFPSWNRDLNMREAFKASAVWFYQVLARKIGFDRMQDFVRQVNYGNQSIGAEADIDTFWLNGELQITAEQQIEFLRRFYADDLPFSARSIAIVKDIMVVEQTPDYILRGKTGWIFESSPEIGWFVGYLEQNDNVYFFATNVDLPEAEGAAKRIEVTRRCLQDLGGL